MRKIYLIIVSFLFAIASNAQLLTFDFNGLVGNEATANSNSNSTLVTSSTISRGAGITADPNANRFNATNFAATFDATDYFEFTITPTAGSQVTLTSVDINYQRSGTGPISFVLRTSVDAFASDATNTVTTLSTNTAISTANFTFNTFITSTTPVTIRLYGYGASSGAGSFGPGEGAGNDIVVNGNAVVLPAKLTHFKASQANNLTTIEFTNETEKDVMSYIVEKAIDGGSFTTLKELQPSKNNGEKVSYKITDQSTVTNTNFYRIKIIESTGKTTYSSIVRIDSKNRAPSLNIAPNPVKGKELNLQVSNLPRGAYFVKIFGMNGQVMTQKNMQFDEGSQTYTLPLNNIKAGMYYIEISGAVKMQKQFVVQ